MMNDTHGFSVSTLSSDVAAAMVEKNVWTDQSPVALGRLRLLGISYVDFDGQMHTDGEMVVLDVVAPYVQRIFKTLYDDRFPLHSIKGMEHFNGDDDAAMGANNCSCYNFRAVYGQTGTARLSMHSYGVAVDFNPIQNPYIFKGVPCPLAGKDHLDRKAAVPGRIEPYVPLIEENGLWMWGGHWGDEPDLHHFTVPRLVAPVLATLSPEEGAAFYRTYVDVGVAAAGFLMMTTSDELIQLFRTSDDFDAVYKQKTADHKLTTPDLSLYQKLR